MPRVHFVKSARKKNPVAEIGESYYWWKFRRGGKHFSKTRPRPSQLTQSAYYGTVYRIMEQLEDIGFAGDIGSLEDNVNELVSQLEDLQSETQDAFDNYSEHFSSGDTYDLLEQRIEAVDCAISDISNIDWSEVQEIVAKCEKLYDDGREISIELQERIDDAIAEVRGTVEDALSNLEV